LEKNTIKKKGERRKVVEGIKCKKKERWVGNRKLGEGPAVRENQIKGKEIGGR